MIQTTGWQSYKDELINRINWRDVYGHLTGIREYGDERYSAQCPFHSDGENSFAFSNKTMKWKCFAGCGSGSMFDFIGRVEGKSHIEVLTQLGEKYGIAKPDTNNTLSGEQNAPLKAKSVVAEYVYTDEVGKPKHKEIRYEPKTFRQERYIDGE